MTDFTDLCETFSHYFGKYVRPAGTNLVIPIYGLFHTFVVFFVYDYLLIYNRHFHQCAFVAYI